MLSDLRLLRGEPASEPGAPGLRCPAKDPRSGPARPVLPAAGRATKPNAIADIAWNPTDIPRPSKFIATIAGLDLHIVDDLQAAGPAWTEFQRRAWFTPFQDHGWVAAWLATQRGTARTGMCIVFGYENGQLRLILPLTVKRKFAQTRLAWAAGAINDLNSPLIDPQLLSRIGAETANRIWAAVVQAVAADAVVLTRQPARLAQSDNPFLADGAQGGSCESHALKLGPDWATLYAGLRSSKSRRRLREKAGKLRKAGKLCFKAERNVAQREAMIERILAWKSQQLRSLGDVDPFSEGYLRRTSTSETRSAIFNYARSDPGARKLRVYVLSLDGQPLAGIVALVGRRTFSVLTTAIAPISMPRRRPAPA